MRFYLKADSEWTRVSKEAYLEAEQWAGFRSKFGRDHIATAGFSKGRISGSVEYEEGDLAKEMREEL